MGFSRSLVGFQMLAVRSRERNVQPVSVIPTATIGAAEQTTSVTGTCSLAIPQTQEQFPPTQPMPSYSQDLCQVPKTENVPAQSSDKRQRVDGEE